MVHHLNLLIISVDRLPKYRRYQILVKSDKNSYSTNYRKYQGVPIIWNSHLRLALVGTDLIKFYLREKNWLCGRTIGEVILSTRELFYNEENQINLEFTAKSGLITGALTIRLKALNFGWMIVPPKSGHIYIEPLREGN